MHENSQGKELRRSGVRFDARAQQCNRRPSPRLDLRTLNAEQDRTAAEAADRLQAVRRACDRHGIRHVARIARINDANLSRIIAGKRRASPVTTAALMAAIRRLDAVDTEPS